MALAGLTKFAPLALAPLMLAGPATTSARARWPATSGARSSPAAVVLGLVAVTSGLGDFYGRTLGYQAYRGSPFSVWGLYGLDRRAADRRPGRRVALALACSWCPASATCVSVAALAAAVLIAFQLGITHWFYLYVVWFFPAVMLALLAPGAPRSPSPAAAPAPP